MDSKLHENSFSSKKRRGKRGGKKKRGNRGSGKSKKDEQQSLLSTKEEPEEPKEPKEPKNDPNIIKFSSSSDAVDYYEMILYENGCCSCCGGNLARYGCEHCD